MCHCCGSRNPGCVSDTEILCSNWGQGKINSSFFLDSHFGGNDTLNNSTKKRKRRGNWSSLDTSLFRQRDFH